MSTEFDKILDECIDLINSGETLESCLNKYPDYSEQLKPMLTVCVQTREAFSFEVNVASKEESRRRFNTALYQLDHEYEEKQNVLSWLFGSVKIWAPIVTVIAVVILSFFSFRSVLFPGEPPVEPFPGPDSTPVSPTSQPSSTPVVVAPEPSITGNFVFLISDDVNAIGDFASLNITIEKIGIQLNEQDGQWIEFSPEVAEVDLTQVRENRAQEIWRGNIDDGQYSKVFIQVSEVNGILMDTGELVPVKLPSEKLQMSNPFEINTKTVTSFVFDVTVVAAGNEQSGIKYILKPVVEASGAAQAFERIDGKEKQPPPGQTSPSPGQGRGRR